VPRLLAARKAEYALGDDVLVHLGGAARDRVGAHRDAIPRPTARLRFGPQHVAGDPEPVFAVLREVKPILVTHGFAVVTRYEDVQEVLERDNEFTVALYTPKMEAITGDFILGLDNTPQYEHDHAELRLALRRDDLPRLAESITREAEGIVTRVGSQGSLDVVSAYTDVAPARVVSTYFGTPGPDDATLISWARMLFDEIFINVKNDPAVHNSAMGAAQEMCAYLDDLI